MHMRADIVQRTGFRPAVVYDDGLSGAALLHAALRQNRRPHAISGCGLVLIERQDWPSCFLRGKARTQWTTPSPWHGTGKRLDRRFAWSPRPRTRRLRGWPTAANPIPALSILSGNLPDRPHAILFNRRRPDCRVTATPTEEAIV